MDSVKVEFKDNEPIKANVQDINYIPSYKISELERQANEKERIAYYNEIQRKVANGEFNGKDGKKGEKGDTGTTGPAGKDGNNGVDGKDGYTPVRNVDYWTEEDQTEIKNYCNDYINKTENLYDYTTATKIVGLRIDTGNSKISEGAKKNTITYLEIESNTNYKVTKIAATHFTVATCVDIPSLNVALTNTAINEEGTELSITSGTNDKYLVIYYYNTDDTLTEEEYRKTIKVTKENPTKLSQLENDSNFVNQEYVDNILGAINVELASLTEVAE